MSSVLSWLIRRDNGSICRIASLGLGAVADGRTSPASWTSLFMRNESVWQRYRHTVCWERKGLAVRGMAPFARRFRGALTRCPQIATPLPCFCNLSGEHVGIFSLFLYTDLRLCSSSLDSLAERLPGTRRGNTYYLKSGNDDGHFPSEAFAQYTMRSGCRTQEWVSRNGCRGLLG